jgi:hypothetical protein
MKELTSTVVDWKKIVVVGLLVILTGLVSAGATWYVMEMSKEAELEIKQNEISTLETRVGQLEAELAPDDNNTDEGVTTETTNETADDTKTTPEATVPTTIVN